MNSVPESELQHPTRVVDPVGNELRYGRTFRSMMGALWRSDPPADEAVAYLADDPAARVRLQTALKHGVSRLESSDGPLRRLIEAVELMPAWLDWSRCERGARLFRRAGPLGTMVLGARSLVLGYSAPAGNKPLVLTGRLTSRAVRRLHETARFVQAVTAPHGMRRFQDGFAITVHVRLMHAQVRRLLTGSERWSNADWALPINQHDMVSTTLLFSNVLLDGLRTLGLSMTRQEADDYVHLWRYVGWVIGVEPDLLPVDEAHARVLIQLINDTTAAPDDDSRALVRALLDSPRHELPSPKSPRGRRWLARRVAFGYALCRFLIGDDKAEQLGLPRLRRNWYVSLIRQTVGQVERARRRLPGLDPLAVAIGGQYWTRAVELALKHAPARFELPASLLGSSRGRSRRASA